MLKKLMVTGLALGLAGMSLFGTKEAHSSNIAAAAGYAISSASCISRSGAALINGCSTVLPSVQIPVAIPSFKLYALQARVKRGTACRGIRYDTNNNAVLGNRTGSPNVSYTLVTLGNLNIPNGSLVFQCDMGASVGIGNEGGVLSLDFT